MAIARILDLCNVVVAGIQNIDPSPAVVQRAYAALIGVSLDNPDSFLQQRTWWVFPAAEQIGRGLDRSTLEHGYDIGVVMAEMWLVNGQVQQGSNPPNSWVDTRVGLVEQVLDGIGAPWVINQGAVAQYFSFSEDTAEITSLYDRDDLLERKLFVSELKFKIRDTGTSVQGSA